VGRTFGPDELEIHWTGVITLNLTQSFSLNDKFQQLEQPNKDSLKIGFHKKIHSESKLTPPPLKKYPHREKA